MLQLMQSTENSSPTEGGILNAKWRTIRYVFAKRSFESQLATILRAAAGHEANQVPAGAHEYQLLSTEADSLCSTFATRWNLDIENLKARIPALAYENPDGSPLQIGTDYFGKPRSKTHPTAGPFEVPGAGSLAFKVW